LQAAAAVFSLVFVRFAERDPRPKAGFTAAQPEIQTVNQKVHFELF
jgi:hypothetical protein